MASTQPQTREDPTLCRLDDELLRDIQACESKEIEAAGKYFLKNKLRRYRMKESELRKKSRWSLGFRGGRLAENIQKAQARIDMELGNPAVAECFDEIKRLLVIDSNPIFVKAVQEWSRKEAVFANRVKRKESKMADLKNGIYQLIGFFSVFQAVLLTAVSQSILLHCNNRLSPIILSVLASVATIFGVVRNLCQIESLRTTIPSDEYYFQEMQRRASTLRRKGVEEFRFAEIQEYPNSFQSIRRSRSAFWFVIACLLVFAVACPVSHWRILCYPGRDPYPRLS